MWLSWIESQTGVPVTEDDVEWAYIGEVEGRDAVEAATLTTR